MRRDEQEGQQEGGPETLGECLRGVYKVRGVMIDRNVNFAHGGSIGNIMQGFAET